MAFTSASFDITASVLYVDQAYVYDSRSVIVSEGETSGSASFTPAPSTTYSV